MSANRKGAPSRPPHTATLPRRLAPLFWDCDPSALSWDDHRDFIIRRVLADGGWEDITWLRRHIGDAALATWLGDHRGGGLEPRQIRFWQLILHLSAAEVDPWVDRARRGTWARRNAR